MRTTSALFAALVAASSVASHDTQPPRRMFYPRHVKRQFTNITVAPEEITPTAETTETTPASTTTRRQSLNEIVDGVLENLFPTASSTLTSSGDGVQSTPFVSPTLSRNGTTEGTTENNESLTDVTSQSSSTVVSVAEPVAGSTSTLESIVLFPTTAITTDAPETTPAPQTTPAADPTTTSATDPLSSLFSEIEDILTSVLPRPNTTATELPTPDLTTIIPIPDITATPSGTGPVTDPITTTPPPDPITTTTPPPVDPITTTPPPVDPPISTNTTLPPPIDTTSPPPIDTTSTPPPIDTTSTPPPIDTATTTKPPPDVTISTSATVTPPPIITPTVSGNVSDPITSTPSVPPTGDGVTSIAPLRTVTNSQSWLPSTVLLDSTTSATVSGGLAPTTATGIPTELPKAINPPSAAAQPEDTEIIQIGLLQGYNYKFVVDETKAAAQVFNLLPKALSYAAGSDATNVRRDGEPSFKSKIMARKLQPLDTVSSLGYLTTVVLVSYPRHLIESLRMDIKLPTSALYNNPDPLVYNFTKQINPAIDITLGSGVDLPGFGEGKGDAPGATGKNDPFGNTNKDEKDSGKQAATAGIVTGAVAVAAAYGAAMFVIARRYKKKKQAHRRASSLTGSSGRSTPSDMQETYRGSPAMGGALLSRDFTSNSHSNYGGVSSGGRERDSHGSHGSGKSGMNTSSRTQYISAPVGAQNSLGWN